MSPSHALVQRRKKGHLKKGHFGKGSFEQKLSCRAFAPTGSVTTFGNKTGGSNSFATQLLFKIPFSKIPLFKIPLFSSLSMGISNQTIVHLPQSRSKINSKPETLGNIGFPVGGFADILLENTSLVAHVPTHVGENHSSRSLRAAAEFQRTLMSPPFGEPEAMTPCYG